jgi:glycosyltransferase involved in cell wall biosynthesis
VEQIVTTLPGLKRVLFVFSWLVVGGEETEVRLLARQLKAFRQLIEVVACFRAPNMSEQTHAVLDALEVPVDRTPYRLSFEETVEYLSTKVMGYDLVVACQAVPDVYPALERAGNPPPLIEHGGLVSEAAATPKHLTARYIGVCDSIREAAAALMPGRAEHAITIPSMVDLSEFKPSERPIVRSEWDVSESESVIGWVGRLDRKKRVEDFIRASELVRRRHPGARFVVIGGADAFMPEYADELRALSTELGLDDVLLFLGDRPDVARLMSGLDALVWLSRGEGMPHVISEAGAASLPVVATRDNGSQDQIDEGYSGLFVPHESPVDVAAALDRLIQEPALGRWLGGNLRLKVERDYSATVLARRWAELFDEVIEEAGR